MHSITELPLHGGRAPRWLYKRMVRLSRAIGLVIIDEYGADELVRRLSDSNWFQALSCTIGYDWHSSGTTTVTVAALKDALNDTKELFIAGGKGKAGTKTPEDIVNGTDVLSIPGDGKSFIEFSRIAAKIDSSLVYDNVGIYHHSFIFSKSKKWAVVQQAIDSDNKKAIRFQWFSDHINPADVAREPHTGIAGSLHRQTLDLTYDQNAWARSGSIDALHEYAKVTEKLSYPARHEIVPRIDISKRGIDLIKRASELDPKEYKDLLLIKGVGRSTLRSLAFVSSLIYDRELAYRDPVTYSYNLGGKDGIPFRINRTAYDSVVENMNEIIDRANIEVSEKYKMLRSLNVKLSSKAMPESA